MWRRRSWRLHRSEGTVAVVCARARSGGATDPLRDVLQRDAAVARLEERLRHAEANVFEKFQRFFVTEYGGNLTKADEDLEVWDCGVVVSECAVRCGVVRLAVLRVVELAVWWSKFGVVGGHF